MTSVDRFTGKERDSETGLDYFGARYMSAAQGRFTSPDVPLLDQNASNPQSWNLYAYVRNNPLKFTDPDGQVCIFGFGNTCDSTQESKPLFTPPTPAAPPSNPIYPTVDGAGVAAARANSGATSSRTTPAEYASSIYGPVGGGYTYTDPITQGMEKTVDPHNTTGKPAKDPRKATDLSIPPIPQGTQLFGESHSHPSLVRDLSGTVLPVPQQIGGDVQRANLMPLLHKKFEAIYVGLPDGRVIKYEPQKPSGQRFSVK